jgi:hypothetical protein
VLLSRGTIEDKAGRVDCPIGFDLWLRRRDGGYLCVWLRRFFANFSGNTARQL